MPRQARQRSVSGIYHVIQRGIDQIMIFRDDDDRQKFLDLLKIEAGISFKIYCYCLMDNHIHFIVESNKLSFHVHRIASLYATWFNGKYGRRGYLFQDRFKSEVIEEEGYLLRCFKYILNNPVKAGMSRSVADYKWSSYRLCFNKDNSFVETNFLSLFFDSEVDIQTYLREGEQEECMDIDQNYLLNDGEVQVLIEEKLNGKKLTEFSVVEQKRILREVKQNPGVRNRQLARITGIGFNIIQRL